MAGDTQRIPVDADLVSKLRSVLGLKANDTVQMVHAFLPPVLSHMTAAGICRPPIVPGMRYDWLEGRIVGAGFIGSKQWDRLAYLGRMDEEGAKAREAAIAGWQTIRQMVRRP